MIAQAVALLTLLAATARADGPAPARIAFGSCAHQSRHQDFWPPILAQKPDLFIFAGDNIYADTYRMDLQRAKYAQLGAQPGFQALRRLCPILATWDDHDYGLNDSGEEFREKEGSRLNFLDFWGVPPDAPRRQRAGVYDAAVFGPPGRRVQVILLDTRYHRSPLAELDARAPGGGRYTASPDPKATILGDAQWAWLAEELRRPAEVRLLVSSIQVVAEDHAWEKWMNFPAERDRLLRTLHAADARGMIALSGDRHHAELSRLDDARLGYPLYDLTASGLNQSHPDNGPEPNRRRVGDVMVRANHFGVVAIDWSSPDPAIALEIHTLDGKVPLRHTLRLSELAPGTGAP